MKKIISLLIAAVMIFGITACSRKNSEAEKITTKKSDLYIQTSESITKKIIETIAETVSNTSPPEIAVSDPTIVNFQSRPCQPQAAIRGTADLALNLLKQNLDTPNAVVSPASVAIALTMTGSGAKGETLKEFEKTLGSDIVGMQEFVEAYINDENSNSDSGISFANSVWLNNQKNRLTVNPDFINICENKFDAKIFKEEFSGKTTANKINKWISDETDEKIKNVLEDVPDDAVAYLINTVLFEAEWLSAYTSRDVVPNSVFKTADGRNQSITMLKSTETVNDISNFRLGKTEAVCKLYKNGYRFVAMLPDEGVSIESALNSFSGNDFMNAVTKTNTNENGEVLCGIKLLNVYFPKFEFECRFKLSDTLKALGMTKSFSGAHADFTNMATSTRGNIFINEVFHNTYIKFDEKGTKAAASTAVEMFDEACMEAPQNTRTIMFDRPFVYFIVSPDGVPLFAGTVTDFEAK